MGGERAFSVSFVVFLVGWFMFPLFVELSVAAHTGGRDSDSIDGHIILFIVFTIASCPCPFLFDS